MPSHRCRQREPPANNISHGLNALFASPPIRWRCSERQVRCRTHLLDEAVEEITRWGEPGASFFRADSDRGFASLSRPSRSDKASRSRSSTPSANFDERPVRRARSASDVCRRPNETDSPSDAGPHICPRCVRFARIGNARRVSRSCSRRLIRIDAGRPTPVWRRATNLVHGVTQFPRQRCNRRWMVSAPRPRSCCATSMHAGAVARWTPRDVATPLVLIHGGRRGTVDGAGIE